MDNNSLEVYVDGSFNPAIPKYSFGCIFLLPDGSIHEEMGNGDSPDCLAIRNVAGEMLGAMQSVRFALLNGFTKLKIYYDYSGIEKWATGEWKRNNDLTKKYHEYMKNQGIKIQISFEKVPAHSGNKYNELVDKLAKKALTEADGVKAPAKIR